MSWHGRHCAVRFVALFLAAGFAACGVDEERNAPEAVASEAAALPPPAWDHPAGAAPHLSLGLNGSARIVLYRGWPLILHASLLHPTAFEPGVTGTALAIDGATLAVRVANDRGEPQSWPLHRVGPALAELRLGPDDSAEAVWWLDGGETAALEEGRYALRLVLAVPEAASPVASLEISAEPAPLAPERVRAKRFLELALLRLRGDAAAARAAVNTLLSEGPDDLAALEASGDLFAADGQQREAFDAYSRALQVFFERTPRPDEPPAELLLKQLSVFQGAVSRE